jgi:hypothetical protein
MNAGRLYEAKTRNKEPRDRTVRNLLDFLYMT